MNAEWEKSLMDWYAHTDGFGMAAVIKDLLDELDATRVETQTAIAAERERCLRLVGQFIGMHRSLEPLDPQSCRELIRMIREGK